MTTPQIPPPGSFGLARITGTLGKVIAAGQAFAGDGSRWTHAFIVLDHEQVIEAEPGGAVITPLAHYLSNKVEAVISDKPVQDWLAVTGTLDGTTDPEMFSDYLANFKREQIVEIARGLKGTPYGYLQYLSMGLIALGIEWKWLTRIVTNRRRMICSQLVDEVYRRANIQLFNDHRLPQNVTPGDLAIWAEIA